MTDTARDDDGSRTAGSVRRSAWALVVVLVVAGYAGVLLLVGGEDALVAMGEAGLVPLAVAALFAVAVVLVWPFVHRASLQAVGSEVRYGEALEASMTLLAVSHTIPGGGAVGAAAVVERLGRFGVAGPAATASIALTGLLSVTTICAVGAAGIAVAVVTGELPGRALGLAAAVLVVLAGIVALVLAGLRSPGLGERVISRLGRLHHRLERRADRWRESWSDVTGRSPTPRDLAPIIGWCAAKWTADLGMLAFVFVAFGHTPRLTMLLIGFGASQVLAAIPATPGAVGFVEGGMVGAFALFGVPVATATLVVFTYRILETWLPALAGMPVLLRPRSSE